MAMRLLRTFSTAPKPLQFANYKPLDFPKAPLSLYVKVFCFSSIVGAIIEIVMIKGGYYDILVEAEGKKLIKEFNTIKEHLK
jgi:hypothetical protein